MSSGARGHQVTRDVAGSTAVGAGTGAAIGAVGGAVTGNAALLHGIFGTFQSRDPDPV